MKSATLAICALAGAAVAMFAVWAFGVRDSGGTVYVTVEGSGTPGEDEWAVRICTAVADWERAWKGTVIEPTEPTDPGTKVPIAAVIGRMQRLTQELRTDIDRIVSPTDRVRKWQRYLAKTARDHARKVAKLESNSVLKATDYVGPRAQTRAGVLNRYADWAWLDISRAVRDDANFASPYLGLLFAEADACDDADRYSATGTDWP